MRIPTPVSTPTKKGTVSTDATFNGVTFTAAKARTFESGAYSETVTPKYSENLAGKALFEFRNQACEPLDPPFTLSTASIKVALDSTFFNNNNKIMMQLYNLRTRLASFCLESVFDILPMTDTGALDTSATATVEKLLDVACIISKEHVRASKKMYAKNVTEKIHPQNLVWTQDLLLKYCNATLRTDLEHRLVSILVSEQGGHLVLHMILNQLMSTSHESARAIVNRLQTISVCGYPGENITTFCATFNNVVLRLNISGHVPTDLCNIFFYRLQTCSVVKFTNLLDSFDNNGDPILQDYFRLCKRVMQKYNDLLLSDLWLPTTKNTSSFRADQGSTTISDTKQTTTRKPTPIDTTPPGTGDNNWKPHPHIPKKQIWWCAECPKGTPNGKGRWGNHSTDCHDPNKVGLRTKQMAANTTTTNNNSTPSTSDLNVTTVTLSSTATPDF